MNDVSGHARATPVDASNEWFVVTRADYLQFLSGVPGFVVRQGAHDLLVHRSVLRLLPEELRPTPDAVLVATASNAARDAATAKLGYKLRGYQHDYINWSENRRGEVCALQQRLGKTPTLVTRHDLTKDGKFLVIGPKSSRMVWLGWMKRRWPDAKIVGLTGRKPDLRTLQENDAIFCHFEILPAWQFTTGIRFGRLVLDEAHLLSNPRSKRTQASYLFSALADRTTLSTGTLIWNKPSGMFPLLQAIAPGAWGTYYEYARRYCDGHQSLWGFKAEGSSNEEEFQARLSDLMFRRTWQDVMPELPGISRTVESVTLTVAEQIQLDKELEIDREAHTASETRTVIGESSRFRRLLGGYKLHTAVEAAARILEEQQESVIIWTWHKELCDKIAEHLNALGHSAWAVHGDVPAKKREAIIGGDGKSGIWNATNPGALCITMAVGQVAIDLSHARHNIFAELDYTPTVLAQAEMRPFSPDHPITSTFITTDFGLDIALTRTLLKKVTIADRLGVPCSDSNFDVLKEAMAYLDVFGGQELDLMASLFD